MRHGGWRIHTANSRFAAGSDTRSLLDRARPSRLEVETHLGEHTTWITIRGEVDVSNHHRLESALADVDLRRVGRVKLQLSELENCGVRTLYRFLNFALEAREHHCDVAMVDPSPLVQLMTRLLEVDDEASFEPLQPSEN